MWGSATFNLPTIQFLTVSKPIKILILSLTVTHTIFCCFIQQLKYAGPVIVILCFCVISKGIYSKNSLKIRFQDPSYVHGKQKPRSQNII